MEESIYIIIWNALVTIMYKKLREKILGEEIISLPHTAVIKWIETEVKTSWKCSLNDKFDQFIDISIKETFESSLGLQVLVDTKCCGLQHVRKKKLNFCLIYHCMYPNQIKFVICIMITCIYVSQQVLVILQNKKHFVLNEIWWEFAISMLYS